MEKVLFISNKIFLDTSLPEGGVRLCTMDFIELLQAKYDVSFLKVSYNRSILFRLRFRLGIDAYEEYIPADYHAELNDYIINQGIRKIFINLSNLSAFADYIKKAFAAYNVKVVLCSHGNESGDFLHQSTRFTEGISAVKRLFSSYRLGKVLKKEALFRQNAIDCVLTVSEVEEDIEKWLGAKQVCCVPRVFKKEYINWQPVIGRIGFVGDVSHPPNYFGLLQLCESFEKSGVPAALDIRIVGKENANTATLKNRFPFVTITGYMDNKDLVIEAGTWNYYLNLVFYYSKGVSTKLEKGMNWGLPIISTTAGNRGYVFNKGEIPTFNSASDVAIALSDKLANKEKIIADREQTLKAVENTITYKEIMDSIYPVLSTL